MNISIMVVHDSKRTELVCNCSESIHKAEDENGRAKYESGSQ